MSKSRTPFTLIWLSAPGAKARHIDVPRAITTVLGVLGALSLCFSLCVGRKVRAWFDAEELRLSSASMLAARDRAQSPAHLRDRAAAFDATQPWATYTELANQQLKLYDVNAQRSIAVSPFRSDGRGDPQAFAQLREFMRCRRTGHTMDMSPRLVHLLMRISAHFDGAELQIISAHRAPDGVVTSETSQHGKGTASDIRIAGVDVETLAAAAHEEGARGVGIYTQSRFVHVDVREKPYAWRGLNEGSEEGESGEGAGEAEDVTASASEHAVESAQAPAEQAIVEEGESEKAAVEPAKSEEPQAPRAVEYHEETLEGATLSGL